MGRHVGEVVYPGGIVIDPPLSVLKERLVRNLIQVLQPVLLIVVASGKPPGLLPLVLSVFGASVVTVLKYAAEWHATCRSAWWVKLLDRVVPAAASAVLAFIPLDWSGSILVVHWVSAGYAALASSLLAVIMLYGDPPSQEESR